MITGTIYLLNVIPSVLIIYTASASGEYGFIKVKAENQEGLEFCTSFNSQFKPLPHLSKAPWSRWDQVTDLYDDLGCKKTNENFKKTVVIIKRGNCTFADKALIAQRSKGTGILVVNDGELLIPGLQPEEADIINISASVITKNSYDEIVKYQTKFKNGAVRIWQYQPEIKSGVDPNVIVMWLLAVCTCAMGAWLQGSKSLTKQRIPLETIPTENNTEYPDDNEDNFDDPVLHITTSHAVIFFFMCSVSILLMYFFFDYLVYVLICVFCYASTVALFDMLYGAFKLSPCFTRYRLPANNLPFFSQRPPVLGILLFALCASFGITWAVHRKWHYAWIMQDTLGVSFCIYMIKTIKLPSFKVSTLLLVLFFVYDVFYVFVTPLLTKNKESIMVHVATGGDGSTKEEIPMLFKLPKFLLLPLAKCADMPYSMLGFGDIILPGLHVGFCATWDAKISHTVKYHTYYLAAVCGYGIGLVLTFIAMYVMMMGQPALLYLVPCCLLSTLFVALRRNELKCIWDAKKAPTHPQPSAGKYPEENHGLLESDPDL